MKQAQHAVTLILLSLMPVMAYSAGNAVEGQRKSEVCHACHGATGISTQPIYPMLAGQQQDYMAKVLRDYRDKSRNNAIMNGFAGTLSDEDIEDITAWYANQQGLTEIQDK